MRLRHTRWLPMLLLLLLFHASRERCQHFAEARIAPKTEVAAEVIVPHVPGPLAVDARHREAVWENRAARLPGVSNRSEGVDVEVDILTDGQALWLMMRGQSPPWETIEIAFQLTDCLEEWDRFLVGSDGRTQITRQRIAPVQALGSWQADLWKDDDRWILKVRIPFETFGMEPIPGEVFEAGVGIQGKEGRALVPLRFVPCYLEKRNQLPSPDLSDRSRWSFTEGDEAYYEATAEGIRIHTPGRYSIMQQSVQLRPHAFYRLEAEVKGQHPIYVRARTAKKRKDRTDVYDFWSQPSEEFRRYVTYFPTGETGEALIILGSVESSGRGEAFVRHLAVVREIQYESSGPRIEISGEPVLVEKLPVKDCRALRGFIAAPVDGRLDSPRWDAHVWEYNQRGAGAGVGYAYHQNDGLHITLGDGDGVDALLVRGKAQALL